MSSNPIDNPASNTRSRSNTRGRASSEIPVVQTNQIPTPPASLTGGIPTTTSSSSPPAFPASTVARMMSKFEEMTNQFMSRTDQLAIEIRGIKEYNNDQFQQFRTTQERFSKDISDEIRGIKLQIDNGNNHVLSQLGPIQVRSNYSPSENTLFMTGRSEEPSELTASDDVTSTPNNKSQLSAIQLANTLLPAILHSNFKYIKFCV